MDEKNNLPKAENMNADDVVQTDLSQSMPDDSEATHHSSEHSHHSHHHSSKHSHHHHHHRHNHRHKNPSKKIFRKFLKKHRSVLINILCCTLCLIILVSYALYNEGKTVGDANNSSSDITKSSIRIESTIFTEDVSLVSKAVAEFMSSSNTKSAKNIYTSYNGAENKLNIGLPVKYSYKVTGIPTGMSVKSAVLKLSENESRQNAQTYYFGELQGNMEIYNLKPSTHYYYTLELTLSSGNVIGTTGDFKTVAAPRILTVDGALNVRDIGGWSTSDGKNIKYGLIYRGSEIDGAYESDYVITQIGLDEMLKNLGIKFEMDLRTKEENVTKDVLGETVTHKYYGVGQYTGILDASQNEIISEIFSDLANEENYPVYIHCTYGKDRTGTICYLLEGLLGVNSTDLRKEYELSDLTYSNLGLEDFAVFVDRINSMEGNTTQEKIENYLLSVGVTAEEIASIRNILLG